MEKVLSLWISRCNVTMWHGQYLHLADSPLSTCDLIMFLLKDGEVDSAQCEMFTPDCNGCVTIPSGTFISDDGESRKKDTSSEEQAISSTDFLVPHAVFDPKVCDYLIYL